MGLWFWRIWKNRDRRFFQIFQKKPPNTGYHLTWLTWWLQLSSFAFRCCHSQQTFDSSAFCSCFCSLLFLCAPSCRSCAYPCRSLSSSLITTLT
jgi:hypothetical protein